MQGNTQKWLESREKRQQIDGNLVEDLIGTQANTKNNRDLSRI